jgi:hypothetical protein
MFNEGNHKIVIDEIATALRRACDSKSRTRRMSFKAIPFDNRLKFKGVPLAEVMVPIMPQDISLCQGAFDIVVDNIFNMQQPLDGVDAYLPTKVLDWLAQWTQIDSKLVMLLWATGKSLGLEINYDDSSILLSDSATTFGINNRRIVSKFNDGKTLSIMSPEKLLLSDRLVRTFSARNIAMYREAYRNGEATTNALLAMLTAYPYLDLWKTLKVTPVVEVPSISSLRRWERIIINEPDPVISLYRLIVPGWMSRAQFARTLGRPVPQGTQIGHLGRQRMVAKMYQYFYKNKEDSK